MPLIPSLFKLFTNYGRKTQDVIVEWSHMADMHCSEEVAFSRGQDAADDDDGPEVQTSLTRAAAADGEKTLNFRFLSVEKRSFRGHLDEDALQGLVPGISCCW